MVTITLLLIKVILPCTFKFPNTLPLPLKKKLFAVTFPARLICPALNKLPEVVLPTTVRLPKLPTVVKLLEVTFELSVFPINPLA